LLERAVVAVKEDKAKALDMFNKGEDGFKDRDLYVFCSNVEDGIVTAHPYGNKGKQLKGDFRQEGLFALSRDDGEGHRRRDKRGYVLVATLWLRQAS
jgi:hypothetical protein